MRHALVLALLLPGVAHAYTGYLRTPDLSGELVAFAAEGDLWTVPVSGGVARRLTASPGTEGRPRFSPDGKWIAYTADLDGNVDVYVVPVQGGEPRRVTWSPHGDQAIGWSADGRQIVFRSGRSDPNGAWHVFHVPAAGGDAVEYPIGWAAALDEEPGTGRLAFTRTTREGATWKRYRGGTAADVWVGDPRTGTYTLVTDFAGADESPMWGRGRVWFLSDRGGTANLWSMAPDGSDRRAATRHQGWDARQPAASPDGRIVYTLAGDVWVYDPSTDSTRKVEIDLPGERLLARTRYLAGPDNLTAWDLSPDGGRLLLTVRGDVWSVPVKPGPSLPVFATSGARESWAAFTDDGKRVVAVTDASGEEAIVSADAWGRGDLRTVVPAGSTGWHLPLVPSPDGARVAWGDQTQTLWVATLAGGAPVRVDHSEQAEIREYAWSPDGRYLAYTKADRADYRGVSVWDSRDGSVHVLSTDTTDDFSPAWDPDGRYLYFLSSRAERLYTGAKDYEYLNLANVRPYAVLLRPDVEDPFAALAGLPSKPGAEATKDDEKKKKAKKDEKKKGGKGETAADDADAVKPGPVAITWDGLGARVVALPVPAGQIGGLAATSGRVFYVRWPLEGSPSEGPPAGGDLVYWDLEGRKEASFTDAVAGFMLNAKGDKLAIEKMPADFWVVDPGGAFDAAGPGHVDTSQVVVSVDPAQEWRQIYFEAWRLMRDFFWDPAMGGVDWVAERDRYAALLPRMGTRDDVRDLVGEVIGELATSHTYVWGGDPGRPPPERAIGQLGADVVREGDAFRVTRIYRPDPADNLVNPLQTPSAAVKEGEYVLAVNHQPFAKDRPFDAAFEALADRPVVLTVNGRPSPDGARDVVVVPVGDDERLRYHDWVRRNREYVAEKTGGRFGYVHLPDMGESGLVAFDTWFYPQLDEEGLVVDVRWNRGGNISQMLVQRLQRQVLQYFFSRGGGRWTYPDRTLNGPFVVITNEFAGSDGDIFPTSVQTAKLAPVIGMRSWGGVIGIRMDKPSVDGGALSPPEYATWLPQRGWAVENHGVDPDIVVQNPPQEVAAGVDAQLDRAIAELTRLHGEHPPIDPARAEPKPTKTRGDFERVEP